MKYHNKFVDNEYTGVSFWLSSSGDNCTPRLPLNSDLEVDVAILGGGFSGLWTALFLLENEPSLEIAIVESEICGFGASGRNGAWCAPRFPLEPHALISRFGREVARRTIAETYAMVVDIGERLAAEGIDAEYRNTGLLSVARSDGQMKKLQKALAVYQELGLASGSKLLSADEARETINVTKLVGALKVSEGATIHPGKLVRGLARRLEQKGVTIFEQSRVIKVNTGANASLETTGGRVRARRAVVAAGEAYLSAIPPFRRKIMPMSSMIILTEPLTASQWDAIGWAGGESLSSPVNVKNYLTRTSDGRILYGSRGAPYLYGSRIPEAATRDPETFAWMEECLTEWFPALAGIPITHRWGGYLGVPRDWMPTVHFDADEKLAWLGGYTGRGVTTSALCAKTLASAITGLGSSLESLPFNRRKSPKWEPEPLRWIGARYVQNAFARIDQAEHKGCHKPIDSAFATYIGDQ